MYDLGFSLDYKIINTHIQAVLSQDGKFLAEERKKINGQVTDNWEVAQQSLAFNLFDRCYLQAGTIYEILNHSVAIDITSAACCVRSLIENLLDYVYLFNCPILKSEVAKEQIEISAQGDRIKYIIHELYGLAFMINQRNFDFTDINYITENLPLNLEEDFKIKSDCLQTVGLNNFIEKKSIKTINTDVKGEFKTLLDRLVKPNFSAIAQNTHRHQLLSKIDIIKVNGFTGEIMNFYSYLSDHCHSGKASLLERSMGLYDNSSSKTLKLLNQLTLFCLTQFYLIYVYLRKRRYGKGFGMQSEYIHEATGQKYSTIDMFHYWINYYRTDKVKRNHFIEEQ